MTKAVVLFLLYSVIFENVSSRNCYITDVLNHPRQNLQNCSDPNNNMAFWFKKRRSVDIQHWTCFHSNHSAVFLTNLYGCVPHGGCDAFKVVFDLKDCYTCDEDACNGHNGIPKRISHVVILGLAAIIFLF